jgi:DNA-binding phage protein
MTTKSIQKEVTLSPYDVADHLRTPEEINAFLEACTLEAEGNADFLDQALAAVARAKVKHRLI